VNIKNKNITVKSGYTYRRTGILTMQATDFTKITCRRIHPKQHASILTLK